MFDPIAEGQKTAKENAKADRRATEHEGEAVEQNLNEAQKLAKKNAKLDDSRRGEAEMLPQDVGTAERDIPEGAPVTDTPKESQTDEEKVTSKDADVKKDMPDEEKRQNTDKDSATPSPSAVTDGNVTDETETTDETEEDSDELPEVSTDMSLKELQAVATKEEVEGDFTKPGTSKQSVVDAILAKRTADKS
jgi:hypothetical protein